MSKYNKRVIQNAHKIHYVAKVVGSEVESLKVLSQLFETPKIEFDVAAWAAEDLGLITINDDNTFELHDKPDDLEYDFGELANHLIEVIPLLVARVNKYETVIEEGAIQNQCNGFPQQDVICALKWIEGEGLVTVNKIVDVDVIKFNREERRKREDGKTEERIESEYYFYTLPENADKDWHEKQFKDAKQLQSEQAQAK